MIGLESNERLVSSSRIGGMTMTVNEYLEENDLDYDDIILKNEDGEVIKPATLIQYCNVIRVDGNEVIIK